MAFYPEKISQRFYSPAFCGEIQEANVQGVSASFSCGSSVRFVIKIESDSKEIASAKFKTSGCGYMAAAADLLAEMVTNKKLVDLHGLHDDVIKGWVRSELGEFP